MRYLKISECDTKNGLGCRVTVWFSGCNMTPKCDKCFNSLSWDCTSGEEFTSHTKDSIFQMLDNDYITGLTITGGNPTDFLEDGVILDLAKDTKKRFPNKDIWLWSGDTFETLCNDIRKLELLTYIDVLVDGRYIDKKRNVQLNFRGSNNQRIIDLKNTFNKGSVVIWEER